MIKHIDETEDVAAAKVKTAMALRLPEHKDDIGDAGFSNRAFENILPDMIAKWEAYFAIRWDTQFPLADNQIDASGPDASGHPDASNQQHRRDSDK